MPVSGKGGHFAWTYIARLDVHHATIFGRCESKNGIVPCDRLVEQVMTRPPSNDARRRSESGLHYEERISGKGSGPSWAQIKLTHNRIARSVNRGNIIPLQTFTS